MFRRLAASALAFVGAAALVTAVPATTTDLYVNQNPGCGDGPGSGSHDFPFCTIQAAADVALPGQTVHVAAREYAGATITRSGAPGAPITFVGTTEHDDKPGSDAIVGSSPDNGASPHAFTVSGAHDVAISTFTTSGAAGDAVVVDNSSRVTIDSDDIEH